MNDSDARVARLKAAAFLALDALGPADSIENAYYTIPSAVRFAVDLANAQVKAPWPEKGRAVREVEIERGLDPIPCFHWSTPAPDVTGARPDAWRCSSVDDATRWITELAGDDFPDVYADHYPDQGARKAVLFGLRDNRGKARISALAEKLDGVPGVHVDNGHIILTDEIPGPGLRLPSVYALITNGTRRVLSSEE